MAKDVSSILELDFSRGLTAVALSVVDRHDIDFLRLEIERQFWAY
jgi:hypothetical protein